MAALDKGALPAEVARGLRGAGGGRGLVLVQLLLLFVTAPLERLNVLSRVHVCPGCWALPCPGGGWKLEPFPSRHPGLGGTRG